MFSVATALLANFKSIGTADPLLAPGKRAGGRSNTLKLTSSCRGQTLVRVMGRERQYLAYVPVEFVTFPVHTMHYVARYNFLVVLFTLPYAQIPLYTNFMIKKPISKTADASLPPLGFLLLQPLQHWRVHPNLVSPFVEPPGDRYQRDSNNCNSRSGHIRAEACIHFMAKERECAADDTKV